MSSYFWPINAMHHVEGCERLKFGTRPKNITMRWFSLWESHISWPSSLLSRGCWILLSIDHVAWCCIIDACSTLYISFENHISFENYPARLDALPRSLLVQRPSSKFSCIGNVEFILVVLDDSPSLERSSN
jgi:hypothetical protein